MGDERDLYQQLRENYRYQDKLLPSWFLADLVAAAGMAELPRELFTDPTQPRVLGTLASQDCYTPGHRAATASS